MVVLGVGQFLMSEVPLCRRGRDLRPGNRQGGRDLLLLSSLLLSSLELSDIRKVYEP